MRHTIAGEQYPEIRAIRFLFGGLITASMAILAPPKRVDGADECRRLACRVRDDLADSKATIAAVRACDQ